MALEDGLWDLLDALHLGEFFDSHNIPPIILPIAIIAMIALLFFIVAPAAEAPPTQSNATASPAQADLRVGLEGASNCNILIVSIIDSRGALLAGPKETTGRSVLFEDLPKGEVYAEASSPQSGMDPVSSQATHIPQTSEVAVRLPEDYCRVEPATASVSVSVTDSSTGGHISATVTIFDSGGTKRDSKLIDGEGVFAGMPTGESYYLAATANGYYDYNGEDHPFHLKPSDTATREISMIPLEPASVGASGTLRVCVTPSASDGEVSVYDSGDILLKVSKLSYSTAGCLDFILPAGRDYYAAVTSAPPGCAISGKQGPSMIMADRTIRINIPLYCEKTGSLRAMVLGSDGALLTGNSTIELYYENGTKLTTLRASGEYTDVVEIPAGVGVYVHVKNVPEGYLEKKSDVVEVSGGGTQDVAVVLPLAGGDASGGCGGKGDLNNDGVINNDDIALMDGIIDSLQSDGTHPYVPCADLDGDNAITSHDQECLADLNPDCAVTCEEEMKDGGRCSSLEICNDGYDNNCDGQTDRETYFNGQHYSDLCSCNKDTPCDMIRDLSGGTSTSYANVARCAELSYLGNGYAWHTAEELACNQDREGESLACAGQTYTCEQSSGSWQWGGGAYPPDGDHNCGTSQPQTGHYELDSPESIPLTDWPMMGRDFGHTNYYPGDVDMSDFRLLWKQEAPPYEYSDAVRDVRVSEGRLYYTNDMRTMHALNASTGERIWEFSPTDEKEYIDLGGEFILGDFIYMTTHKLYTSERSDYVLKVLDKRTGQEKPEMFIGGVRFAYGISDKVLIGINSSGDDRLFAYDLEGKKILWEKKNISSNIFSAGQGGDVAVKNGKVYATLRKGCAEYDIDPYNNNQRYCKKYNYGFCALDLATGLEEWCTDEASGRFSIIGDTIYFSMEPKEEGMGIQALNAMTGEKVFQSKFVINGHIETMGDYGGIVPTVNNHLVALGYNAENSGTSHQVIIDSKTGESKALFDLRDLGVIHSATITRNNVLFFEYQPFRGRPYLYFALNATTGEFLWAFPIFLSSIDAYGAPVIADGNVYLFEYYPTGSIYAFGPKHGAV